MITDYSPCKETHVSNHHCCWSMSNFQRGFPCSIFVGKVWWLWSNRDVLHLLWWWQFSEKIHDIRHVPIAKCQVSYPTWNPLEARPYRRGAGDLLGSQWLRPASVTLGLVEITWFSKTIDIYRLYTSMFYVGFKETKYKSKTWLWHSAKGMFHALVLTHSI